jgi:hypothetical protein
VSRLFSGERWSTMLEKKDLVTSKARLISHVTEISLYSSFDVLRPMA